MFPQEGVGDTPDSYAYDGNRVRKWNVTTTNYGKVNNDTEIKSKMEICKDEVGLCHFISPRWTMLTVYVPSVVGSWRHRQLSDRPGRGNHHILPVSKETQFITNSVSVTKLLFSL